MAVAMAHRLNFTLAASLLAAALLAACTQLEQLTKKPGPDTTPKVTETMLREKAEQNLALGLRQYEAGSYDDAARSFTAALDHGLLSKPDQSTARKNLAFIYCASNREQQCRDEFRKALEINPRFDLTTAEAGHPIWGPVYRNVRAQMVAEAPAPESKPRVPLTRAEQLLADGMAKYDAGDFEAAYKLLEAAQKEGLTALQDRLRAGKHAAFSLCLIGKFSPCRVEFQKLFDIDPNFDLTPAESGHPSWTKTYATAKQRAKEAREHAAREKAAAEKAAADKAAAEKVKADKAAADKLKAEKIKADKAAADKLKADKAAREPAQPAKDAAKTPDKN